MFGALHPSRGIDWQYFESTAKKEGLEVAQTVEYSVPVDLGTATVQYQEDAPVLVAKLKDAGVTTVLLYAFYVMVQDVFKAADDLDYHPEWVFPGFLNNDIEVIARMLDGSSPDQMKHVFGFGSSPPYVAGIDDPIVSWFNWYWGKNEGVYSVGPIGALADAARGRQPRRTEAHTGAVPAGPVQHPRERWGGQQPGGELHGRLRAHHRPSRTTTTRSAGPSTTRSSGGTPTRSARASSSSTTAPAASCTSTGPSATTRVNGPRASRSCSTRTTRSPSSTGCRHLTSVPDYPCEGCPSATR